MGIISTKLHQRAQKKRPDQPDSTRPDLKNAWKYKKENILPRRVKEDGGYRKLEPGETGGEIYGVWETPLAELGDFGLGIGLYFGTLVGLIAVVLISALLNIYNIDYYKSNDYTGGQGDLELTLQGSAICTSGGDVKVCTADPCTDADIVTMKTCYMKAGQIGIDLTMTIILFIFLGAISVLQGKAAEAMDESEQTAQDYSIIVQDPDEDAINPDEWRDFFESRYGKVVYVTVAKDNGDLLLALAKKRKVLREIHFESLSEEEELRASLVSPQDSSAINLVTGMIESPWKKRKQALGFGRDLAYWQEQLQIVNKQIEELQQRTYKAVKVFVIFDTEEAQRYCLHTLTTGMIPAALETSTKISDKNKFRGTNVLKIEEAVEPTEIKWQNLGVEFLELLKQQSIYMIISIILIGISAIIISATSKISPAASALFISFANAIIPPVLKFMTAKEDHHTDSSYQRSLLLKLVFARWMNTAFIIYAITEFKSTNSMENISQIRAILWADAFTTPILRLINIGGKVQQYILAPLAKTQDKMNSFFQGTTWFLAERYTDMTKTLFVSLFFAILYPAGLFITAVAFFISYWVDKYCLLRVWKTPPALDDKLTRISRMHIAVILLIHVIMTLQFFAGFPFDDVCISKVDPLTASIDISAVTDQSSLYKNSDGEYDLYQSCSQEPDGPDGVWQIDTKWWMTEDQKNAINIYSGIAIAITVLIAVVYFGRVAAFSIYHLFYGSYKPVGESQGISFSQVDGIQAYVPQVIVPGFIFPLLACNLDDFDDDHISWTGDFKANNLWSDRDLPNTTLEQRRNWFSVIKHYPNKTFGSHKKVEEKKNTDPSQVKIEMK